MHYEYPYIMHLKQAFNILFNVFLDLHLCEQVAKHFQT